MKNAGMLYICDLLNTAAAGEMPAEKLVVKSGATFEERTVGYGRYYAAQGVNVQVDLLARIWRDPLARPGMYAVIDESEYTGQYRITNVTQLTDEHGLKVTDLTLTRLDNLYDLDTE